MAHFKVSERLALDITITENRFALPLESLIRFAERDNPRRRFLFVSRVLGKHIPCDPRLSLLTGELLGHLAAEEITGRQSPFADALSRVFIDYAVIPSLFASAKRRKILLPNATVVIGMGETATALGCAAASAFENGYLIHSTREEIAVADEPLAFEEEHSHAVAHYLYLSRSRRFDHAILVDDEMTSGKTFANMIRRLHAVHGISAFTVAVILDWRSTEDRERFVQLEKELNICIRTVSLIAGRCDARFDPNGGLAPQSPETAPLREMLPPYNRLSVSRCFAEAAPGYITETGRFGLASGDLPVETAAEIASSLATQIETPLLCLGYGEFMHLPMAIAAYLPGDIAYHSCTRSPILIGDTVGYGVCSGHLFEGIHPPKQKNYLYNIPKNHYREVLLIVEHSVPEGRLAPLLAIFAEAGIQKISILEAGR